MSSDKVNPDDSIKDVADMMLGGQHNERVLDRCEENLKKAGDALHAAASTDPEFIRVRNEYGRVQLEKSFIRFKNDVNLYGQHDNALNLMLEFSNEIVAGVHNKGVKS